MNRISDRPQGLPEKRYGNPATAPDEAIYRMTDLIALWSLFQAAGGS